MLGALSFRISIIASRRPRITAIFTINPYMLVASYKSADNPASQLRNDSGRIGELVVTDHLECLVRAFQRIRHHTGLQPDISGNLQEVPCILACHVGDAADLPLTPEKRIVIKLWYAVEMDSVDRENPAFGERSQGGDHHFADRSEGDGAIERDWRYIGAATDPFGAELARKLLVLRLTCRHVDFAVPCLHHRHDELRGGAEAEEPDALAVLHLCHTHTAKADDASAEQRCGIVVA